MSRFSFVFALFFLSLTCMCARQSFAGAGRAGDADAQTVFGGLAEPAPAVPGVVSFTAEHPSGSSHSPTPEVRGGALHGVIALADALDSLPDRMDSGTRTLSVVGPIDRMDLLVDVAGSAHAHLAQAGPAHATVATLGDGLAPRFTIADDGSHSAALRSRVTRRLDHSLGDAATPALGSALAQIDLAASPTLFLHFPRTGTAGASLLVDLFTMPAANSGAVALAGFAGLMLIKRARSMVG